METPARAETAVAPAVFLRKLRRFKESDEGGFIGSGWMDLVRAVNHAEEGNEVSFSTEGQVNLKARRLSVDGTSFFRSSTSSFWLRITTERGASSLRALAEFRDTP